MNFEHIFDEMEISSDPFALCELQGQCALGLGSKAGATLHYILAGQGEIILKGHQPIKIQRGSLVLVPTILAHTLRADGASGKPIPDCHPAELNLASHLITENSQDNDGSLLAICSHISVSLKGASGLIDLIRQPLVEVIEGDDVLSDPVDKLLHELSKPSLGSKAMVRTLLLECMIHLLRKRISANDPALNWMAALVDEKLWDTLKLMLDKPNNPHTVESLANNAGMSRSSFAAHFSKAYGKGPMELLRELRMNYAASLLSTTDIPVKRIAEQATFKSRSAFSRVFSEYVGVSPNQFRINSKKALTDKH